MNYLFSLPVSDSVTSMWPREKLSIVQPSALPLVGTENKNDDLVWTTWNWFQPLQKVLQFYIPEESKTLGRMWELKARYSCCTGFSWKGFGLIHLHLIINLPFAAAETKRKMPKDQNLKEASLSRMNRLYPAVSGKQSQISTEIRTSCSSNTTLLLFQTSL